MSAERKPPQNTPHESWLSGTLEKIARQLLRAPVAVIIGGISLAVFAVVVSVLGLGFKTSRLDLLNPKSAYNQRWLAFLDEFGAKDDAVVVVESQNRDAVIEAIEAIADDVNRPNRPFEAVLYKKDLARIREKGLHFLDESDLRQVQILLEKLQPVLRGDWSQLNAGKFLRELNQQIVAGSQTTTGVDLKEARSTLEAAIARFGDSLLSALKETPEYRSPLPELGQLTTRFKQFEPSYLLEHDGRRGFILLRFKDQEKGRAIGGESITELRNILANVGRRHPGIELGLTGMPILEYDEMCSSTDDMTIASIVSLLGVIGLLLAGFGSIRYSFLAIATLILGMCWSFGFITCTVGHLNLLSVSFAAIVMGLGIDFSVHYMARYLQLRSEGQACVDALAHTASDIGPGIITGALTTAVAFFTAGLTDFTGVAELGIIAGAGILICLAGAFWVLPAMIVLVDRERPMAGFAVPLPIDRVFAPIVKRPGWVLVLVLLVSVAVAPGVFKVRYDHNLLNLQPDHMASVDWEKRLLHDSERSVWFAVSICDSREELMARKAQFQVLSSVDRTEEILSLMPEPSTSKPLLVAAIQKRLAALPAVPPLIPVSAASELEEELAKLGMILNAMGGAAPQTLNRVAQLRAQLRNVPAELLSQRLSEHQQRAAGELLDNLLALRSLANPESPTWEDVPEGLVSRFVGAKGKYLLRVYARGDIWDMDALTRFVRQIEHVDPLVTGHPVQTFYASRQMQFSYIHAAIYALFSLLIILMLDFRSIRHSLLALAPLALGVWLMFGVLGLLNIPFNGANMIVLPLILGIGIDNGVHVVHDLRSQTGRFRLTNSIAVSMVLCSATTMVGFCSMIFAKHQGLRSLGQVLTLSMFLCLMTSAFFLPALLSIMTRRREASVKPPEISPVPERVKSALAPRRREKESVSSVESDAAQISPAESSATRVPVPVDDEELRRARRSARVRARRAQNTDV